MIGSTVLNGAALNEAGADAEPRFVDAVGASPLEIGPLTAQNGVPFAWTPAGVDLVRTALHSALLGPVPVPVTVDAAGVRPLLIGDLTAIPGAIVVDAQSATPWETGDLRTTGLALLAESAHPIEIGPLASGWSLGAQGASPFDLGDMALRFQVRVGGADFGASGQHSAIASGVALLANGAAPLEIGPLGAGATTLYAHPSYPLQIGAITVSRAATC